MFYTLISQTPYINNDTSSRKIFKLFIIGSIFYLLLHYYLYSGQRGFLDRYKQYLYYVMAGDFAVAYGLTLLFGKKEVQEKPTKQQDPEEMKKLEDDYRKMLLLKQKQELMNQNKDDYEIFNKKSDEKTSESIKKKTTKAETKKNDSDNESISSKKKSLSSKSSDKKNKKDNKVSNKREEKKESKKEDSKKSASEDVDIPTYKDE